ncbi:hypothetical protein TVAG_402620 [Trichomonas vaginalis G3]|uniref:Uncharacterized protein n=1 Tax=Trichomonas vaginalis (strain ATCC PRA-98 / G3) TaxID=412133 RepID=A2DI17_TRIV3|nr:hypothetical protein TVAG_402620 [Trichomonas vaginalis G3]|eukprot:XP_001580992.1 hypothetical protein [Trichomonas vaginalis G3]
MSYPFASSTDANKYVIFYAKNNVSQFDVVPLLKGGQYMNITYQQIVMESDSEIQFDMYVSNTVYDATKYERKDSYVFISQLSTNLKYDYFEANIGGGQDNTPFPGQAILNFDQNLIPKQFGRHKTGAIDSVFYFGYMPPDKATTMYCRLSATTNTLKYGGKSTLRLNHMNIKNYGTGQT